MSDKLVCLNCGWKVNKGELILVKVGSIQWRECPFCGSDKVENENSLPEYFKAKRGKPKIGEGE